MSPSRHADRLVILLPLLVGVACGKPSVAPSPKSETGLRCDQGYGVSVSNNTHRDVDIVQFTGGRWQYVITVTARSSREVPVPTGDKVEWRWQPGVPEYDPVVSVEVTVHMHCM